MYHIDWHVHGYDRKKFSFCFKNTSIPFSRNNPLNKKKKKNECYKFSYDQISK
jgi:hypothetical protein